MKRQIIKALLIIVLVILFAKRINQFGGNNKDCDVCGDVDGVKIPCDTCRQSTHGPLQSQVWATDNKGNILGLQLYS